MIQSGNIIIIPMEIFSFVVEIKDGKLEPVVPLPGFTTAEICNKVRNSAIRLVKKDTEDLASMLRAFKKYQVSKEFMSALELDYYSEYWKNFDPEKHAKEEQLVIDLLNKAIFEITDLMLEYNLTIEDKEVGSHTNEAAQNVSIDDVKNMLDKFKKSE